MHPPPPLPDQSTPQLCRLDSSGGTRCTNRFVSAGTATVTCSAGALVYSFANAPGMRMYSTKNVVATCDNSDFSQQSAVRAGGCLRLGCCTDWQGGGGP
jgi:hypothetical protein